MQTYIAHYLSPTGSDVRASGLFEFESESRVGTKRNLHDARMRMLELFGKDAVSWSIDKVERKTAKNAEADGQLALDFRPPKPERKRRPKKDYW